MGSISTKHMKDTQTKQQIVKPLDITQDGEMLDQTFVNNDTDIDPRSPHICRTPIHEVIKSRNNVTRTQNLTELWENGAKESPTSAIVAQKLMNNLNINLLDPRSPSQFIDRTPIVFDDSTDLPVYVDVDNNEANGDKTADSLIGVFEKPFVNEDCLVETPKAVPEAKIRDPRSPTDGVECTPIVLSDEVSDQEILDAVMQTLGRAEIQNKPLERVKNPKSHSNHRSRPRKAIYEDKSPKIVANSTPKKSQDDNTPKRTPLSCVANKSHLRSKSVEHSAKSLTNKVIIYDDYKLKNRQNYYSSGESPQTLYGKRLNL